MSEEELLQRFKEIEKQYEKDDDREWLHINCDKAIQEFLLKNGYYKAYTKYRVLSTNFWYA